MSILTGPEILKKMKEHKIVIEGFKQEHLNPNSVDLTLDKDLMGYSGFYLDSKAPNTTYDITIPDEGYVLCPGKLYLAQTAEFTETHGFVPRIVGKSSIGRLGLTIHVTAGFGDVGFRGHWTLELHCIQPIFIYPGMKICQIYYETVEGEILNYNGKYQDQKEIVESLNYKDYL